MSSHSVVSVESPNGLIDYLAASHSGEYGGHKIRVCTSGVCVNTPNGRSFFVETHNLPINLDCYPPISIVRRAIPLS
ncbi:MAG: hypothetical protein WCT01_04910 [Candidatus Shapirobacteria bacterium]